jgi:hypothetical protein
LEWRRDSAALDWSGGETVQLLIGVEERQCRSLLEWRRDSAALDRSGGEKMHVLIRVEESQCYS